MGVKSCSHCDGTRLLEQLELILESDYLIDEVGFVHPSQFATLDVDTNAVQYDESAFWCKDHKLAISMEILPHLYKAARHAYMDFKRRYATPLKLLAGVGDCDDLAFGSDMDPSFESDILRHTRALLILSCDFSSAWNSRKLVISRKTKLSLFIEELHLCTLILSYSPKSEYTWSHRRWLIKMIVEKFPDMHEIVGRESDLVQQITEKSRMNYRAWSHLCRLLPYMTKKQVLDKLNKSRKWSELHVADNCCFHFRRQLLLALLEGNFPEQAEEDPIEWKSVVYLLWKEELEWNELLIKRFIGREALWIHRRFLSQFWMDHFATRQELFNSIDKDQRHISSSLDVFLDRELQLVLNSLNLAADEFEDTQRQAQNAASYIMWISKLSPLSQNFVQGMLREIGGMKLMMVRVCPGKTSLWESLLD